jgi:uncharacterized protein (TIGR00255 family)
MMMWYRHFRRSTRKHKACSRGETMIYSMTGFAAATLETPQGNLALELRTVNHRYLDDSFRLDENLRALEPALREAIAARIGRGKVECRLSLAAGADGDDSLRLNIALVRQLVDMGHLLQEYASDSRPLSVADILRWPGVVGGAGATLEALRQPCLDLLRRPWRSFPPAAPAGN